MSTPSRNTHFELEYFCLVINILIKYVCQVLFHISMYTIMSLMLVDVNNAIATVKIYED